METFDEVISLGGSCETAHNVRRHFNIAKAFPFDWWIVPFDGLISLIMEDFSDILQKDNLEIMKFGWAVRCRRYGIVHHHDFPRSSPSGPVVPERVDETLPMLMQKFSTLRGRLNAVCESDKRVLFVRNWLEILHPPADYPKHLIDGVPQFPYEKLISSIQQRFPKLDFKVLFLNYGNQKIEDPRAAFHNVQDLGDVKDWKGSAKGWDEVLKHYAVTGGA